MELVMNNIFKNYGKKKVLKGVSFQMDSGIYGLLGPNGAGKTTLIRVMAGLIAPSSGKVSYNGKACDRDYRAKLGYLPQDLDFYPNFTGRQYLEYVASLKGLNEALSQYSLRADQYSYPLILYLTWTALQRKVWKCFMTPIQDKLDELKAAG